jgi:hypothetical protein
VKLEPLYLLIVIPGEIDLIPRDHHPLRRWI